MLHPIFAYGRGLLSPYIFIIIVCVAVLAAVAMTAYVIYYYLLAGLLARTVTKPAKVVRKYRRAGGIGSGGFYGDDLSDDDCADVPGCDYFVTFEASGKSMEFPVHGQIFADLHEGDEGLLTHKGTLFRRFLKESRTALNVNTGRTQIRNIAGDE